jgi:hypothetical protein
MDRILLNTSAELRGTFYRAGVATDPVPNTATETVTRASGIALATNLGAPTVSPPPAGTFSYQLAAVNNTLLDRLTAAWTSAYGTVTTNAEVCGGFLIDGSTLVTLYPDDTDAVRLHRRTDIENRLEGACGVAFVPRYERERVTVRGRGAVRLRWGWIRRITAVTAQNLVLSSDQITALDVDLESGVVRGLPLSQKHSDVIVSYEHGGDYADETVRSAAVSAMTETYGPNKVDGRILQKQVDNVSVTYASSRNGASANLPFSSSDVVSFILDNRRPLVR